MKMVVGLGNPGEKYSNTRHNAGFRLLDYFVKERGIGEGFNYQKKFDAEILEWNVEEVAGSSLKMMTKSEKVIFVKPMTYMNLSGKSVRMVRDYYKIANENILVCLDDMDISLGEVRVRKSGRSGGHNGLQSIIDELKTEEILRIKLGIGRPEHSVIKHVLDNFSEEETEVFAKVINLAAGKIFNFVRFENLDNESISIV